MKYRTAHSRAISAARCEVSCAIPPRSGGAGPRIATRLEDFEDCSTKVNPSILQSFNPPRRGALGETRGELDPAEQVLEKERLGVALARVAERRVPRAPALVEPAPGDRMIGAHLPSRVRRLVERGEDMDAPARVGLEVVPLVGAVPDRREDPG